MALSNFKPDKIYDNLELLGKGKQEVFNCYLNVLYEVRKSERKANKQQVLKLIHRLYGKKLADFKVDYATLLLMKKDIWAETVLEEAKRREVLAVLLPIVYENFKDSKENLYKHLKI